MRLGWATDIHLNFLPKAEIVAFGRKLSEANLDALVITGDISEAPRLEAHLGILEQALGRPIYFVLGNHDFYGGSIPEVRDRATRLTVTARHLRWLPAVGVVPLSDRTALVGHDGWSDGRAGDYFGSSVLLNDYVVINELRDLSRPDRLVVLQELAEESATYLEGVVSRALDHFSQVVVATHPPPFREACWHCGEVSDDDWLPHFCSATVGEALRRSMRSDRSMTVLCGHTHSSGFVEVEPGLVVHTGGAAYGRPELQSVLDV